MGLKLALAFPGVGAALTGREQAFLERNKQATAPLMERASARVGLDLEQILARGEVATLDERTAQVLTYTFSCAVARAVTARGSRPVAVAGYSMGLYAALESAGAISFDDGMAITIGAHSVMGRVCQPGLNGLAVTVGLTEAELAGLLAREELAGVRLVNRNNDTALVCAGPVKRLERLVTLALEADAIKAALLPADLPYHHPELLAAAPAAFAAYLAALPWREPACPVISAVTAEAVGSAAGLRDLTAGHLARPIALPPMLAALADLGVDAVVECGPGISLTQSARMVAGAPAMINLKTVQRRLGV